MILKLKKYNKYIKSYTLFLPGYLKSTFFAFLIDVILFVILKPYIGTNLGAITSFLSAQFVLYFLLTRLHFEKISKRALGLSIQLSIGLVTLLIHLIVLNIINLTLYNFNDIFYIQNLDNNRLYSTITKIIAACVGFLWTSLMTKRFTFSSRRKQ